MCVCLIRHNPVGKIMSAVVKYNSYPVFNYSKMIHWFQGGMCITTDV